MHLYKVDSRWVAGRNRVAGMCELTWARRLAQTDNAYSVSRSSCHDAFEVFVGKEKATALLRGRGCSMRA